MANKPCVFTYCTISLLSDDLDIRSICNMPFILQLPILHTCSIINLHHLKTHNLEHQPVDQITQVIWFYQPANIVSFLIPIFEARPRNISCIVCTVTITTCTAVRNGDILETVPHPTVCDRISYCNHRQS